MNIFISGLNQGCGKTMLAAGMAALMQSLGYRAGVYKPIQTGAVDKGTFLLSPDLEFVKMVDSHILTHATYLLTSISTPVAAAEIEHMEIDINDIENDYNILEKNTEILITEGTGGLLTPINGDIFNYHIPLKLKLPVVFVVNPSNDEISGCLNELNMANKAGLDVVGIIINKYPVYSKDEEIMTFYNVLKKYSSAKILGVIRNLNTDPLKTEKLFTEILNGIDIQEILRMKIAKLNNW